MRARIRRLTRSRHMAGHAKTPLSESTILLCNATRAVFFLVGFGLAVWAPLVPYAKVGLELSEGVLGLIMLCLGTGSILTMPITGLLVSRFSCHHVIVVATMALCISIPFLALAPSVGTLSATLLVFGGAVGAIDVAGNIQAVIAQRESNRFMMSGFHAFYSIGGLCGAAGMSLMLLGGLNTVESTLICSAILLLILLKYRKSLLGHTDKIAGGMKFAFPKGLVVVIGFLCFITFLSEGIIFDWGSLFLVEYKAFDATYAGLGMAVFSLMLAVGRLWGGHIIQAMGNGANVVLWRGIGSAIGLLLAVFVLDGMWALLGYALLGFSVSNIVPIIFSAAGQQTIMPVNEAIAIVSTLGYAGTLLGPALIGFAAELTSLAATFVMVSGFMLFLGVAGWRVFGGTDTTASAAPDE